LRTEKKDAIVIVAHPDDETLWAGGAVLTDRAHTWTIVTVCRQSDRDRAPRFFRALEVLGATGAMANLDDGPDQAPLDLAVVENAVLSLLPRTEFDLVVTHNPFGEYTRHRRHEETSRAVTGLWASGRLATRELRLFAYEDGEKQYHPRAIERAHLAVRLDDRVWTSKSAIIQDIYGFEPDSWEARTTPRMEAFWCFEEVQAYRAWLEAERARVQR
jgi:LmbE family N-acetylglucosaminyl deacetylase